MSGQNPQRARRNVSPNSGPTAIGGGSTKQGPLRATLPVSLMRQISPRPATASKKTSPSESPTQSWNHPSDTTGRSKSQKSPDKGSPSDLQKSPGSPIYKEKSKTLNIKASTLPIIRRTSSLDTIYLTGQWPRDTLHTYCGRPLVDKSTQTTDEWEEFNEKKISSTLKQQTNQVSCSGEQLDKFRQRLQRSKESSRQTSANGQHHSPVHGDHSAISLVSANFSMPAPVPPLGISSTLHAAVSASHSVSRAISIPHANIPKTIMRTRNSVEGLNQEIEKLVLKGSSGIEEDIMRQVHEPTPDGHRAPIADLLRHTRNADTQTPSTLTFSGVFGFGSLADAGGSSSNEGGSRCGSGDGEDNGGNGSTTSVSPASYPVSPTTLDVMDDSRPSSRGDVDSGSFGRRSDFAFDGKDNRKSASPEPSEVQLGTSPNINKFFAREPPDGCERVKIVEESRGTNKLIIKDDLVFSLPKPCNQSFKPSTSSAFFAPFKGFDQSVSPTDLVIFTAAPSAHNPPLTTSVEGQ